jgi:hypothetical protein
MARIFGLDLTQIIPLLFLVLVISRDCLLLPFFYFVHLEQIWYVRNQRKKQAPKETSTSSITTRSMLNQLQWRPRPENAQWSFMLSGSCTDVVKNHSVDTVVKTQGVLSLS